MRINDEGTTEGLIRFKEHREIAMEELSEPKQPTARQTLADLELPPSWVRIAIAVTLTLALLLGPVALILLLYKSNDLDMLTKTHAPAMIGVPWAGGAAFIVVLVLRTSFGAINFKVLGVEFKGASGPIVMGVLCFLVEVSAIKLLW